MTIDTEALRAAFERKYTDILLNRNAKTDYKDPKNITADVWKMYQAGVRQGLEMAAEFVEAHTVFAENPGLWVAQQIGKDKNPACYHAIANFIRKLKGGL